MTQDEILVSAKIDISDGEFQEKIKKSQNNAIALRKELDNLNKAYAVLNAREEANTEVGKNLAKTIKLSVMSKITIIRK